MLEGVWNKAEVECGNVESVEMGYDEGVGVRLFPMLTLYSAGWVRTKLLLVVAVEKLWERGRMTQGLGRGEQCTRGALFGRGILGYGA